MTPKERWLAAVRLQPVDRLPFWPKLDLAYPHIQGPPFRHMKIEAIHNWIGSDKHIWIPDCVKEVGQTTSLERFTSEVNRRTLYSTHFGGVVETTASGAFQDGDSRRTVFSNQWC